MNRQPHISPTVGRVVLFHLGDPTQGPYPGWGITPDGSNTYAATVAYVHNPHMVNLSACDANGIQMGFTSVPLVQDADERPAGNWCEWMPYQKGQAAKAEQLEARLAGAMTPAPSGEPPTLNQAAHPAIAGTQRLDNDGNPLFGSQAAPTIPQD